MLTTKAKTSRKVCIVDQWWWYEYPKPEFRVPSIEHGVIGLGHVNANFVQFLPIQDDFSKSTILKTLRNFEGKIIIKGPEINKLLRRALFNMPTLNPFWPIPGRVPIPPLYCTRTDCCIVPGNRIKKDRTIQKLVRLRDIKLIDSQFLPTLISHEYIL